MPLNSADSPASQPADRAWELLPAYIKEEVHRRYGASLEGDHPMLVFNHIMNVWAGALHDWMKECGLFYDMPGRVAQNVAEAAQRLQKTLDEANRQSEATHERALKKLEADSTARLKQAAADLASARAGVIANEKEKINGLVTEAKNLARAEMKKSRKPIVYSWAAIAAVVALVAGVAFWGGRASGYAQISQEQYDKGYESGHVDGEIAGRDQKKQDEAALAWAVSPRGRAMYEMDQAKTLEALTTCNADGWVKELQDDGRTACFPRPYNNKTGKPVPLSSGQSYPNGWFLPKPAPAPKPKPATLPAKEAKKKAPSGARCAKKEARVIPQDGGGYALEVDGNITTYHNNKSLLEGLAEEARKDCRLLY